MHDPRCPACTHPRRVYLDRALLRGDTHAKIMRRFGPDLVGVLTRHLRHIPREVREEARRAQIDRDLARADQHLARVRNLHDVARQRHESPTDTPNP